MAGKFSLRQVIAEKDTDPFEFEGPDGEDLQLPHASTLTPRQAIRMDRGEIEEVLEEVAPDVAAVLLDGPAFATEALMDAWLEHAGMSRGESPASQRSSKSTARPSRQTSKRRTR